MDETQSDSLPPLTAATIKRAQEGLAAARDREVRHAMEKTLAWLDPLSQEYPESRASSRLRRFVLRSLLHALFRIRVEHLERLPNESAILAANHLNSIDPLLLLAELPAQPYYYVFGDGRALYNKWWKRQILSFAGGIVPLDRWWKEEKAVIEGAKCDRADLVELAKSIERDVPTGSDMLTLRQLNRIAQTILMRGEGIILFPEGRLGTAEGKLYLPLKRGTSIYALQTGVPIVPVVVIGTHDLYLWKELTIRFGEPLRFPQSKRPKRQEVDAALEALQAALVALLPTDYQEPEGLKLCRYFLNHMLW